jgi:hypothetical protein
MDMVVHRFNDQIREGLSRIVGLSALDTKSAPTDKDGRGAARLATAP